MERILKIIGELNDIEYGFKDENGNNLINSESWDKDFSKVYFFIKPRRIIRS